MRPFDAVREFLRREGISGSVCCALSGGADSVCLLYCLRELRNAFPLTLSAVHIQHRLRGEESQRDEDFCRDICAAWSIPLTVIPVDVTGFAAAHSLSVETAARECRYAAFEMLPCDYIATAHTASDQLETVLFRMARGTGLRGLCGIPARRDRYLRPLLHVTRDEIEAFLTENRISYVTDSTNLSDEYSRNFIRHHIVPGLKQLNPGAEQNAVRMTDSLREDAAFLDAAAEAAYTQALQADGSLLGLTALHPALQRRILARYLEQQQLPHGYEAVTSAQALLLRGGQLDLDRSGRLVRFSKDVLFITQKSADTEEIPLILGKNQLFPGVIVTAELVLQENSELFVSVHKKFTDFTLDYDIIRGYVKLHGRKPGLRIQPAGRGHHVSVKKWLNAEVPPAQRQYIHFLSDSEGLIWAEGLGADMRVRVTETTRRMLVLYVHRTDTGCT